MKPPVKLDDLREEWYSKDSIIDETGRILYRNNFQKAIERFLEWYRQQLISTTAIQEAFIRKFNSLCD